MAQSCSTIEKLNFQRTWDERLVLFEFGVPRPEGKMRQHYTTHTYVMF